MAIDLKDLTFTIPVKVDHDDRVRNLKTVMEFISHNFDTNIIICEQDGDKIPDLFKNYKFQYMNCARPDGMIHRTYQLNIMAKAATTPFIANYDADVLMKPQQYIDGMNILRSNQANFVIPYAGPCWDVNPQHHQKIFNEHSIDFINEPKNFGGLMNNNSVGGVLFWNKADFIKGGMENENFISWGFEDNERFARFQTLGYTLKRTGGILFHLNHHRTANSNHKHKFYQQNMQTFNKIRSMNKEQLLKEVSTWGWCK